jgi:hypothetical protein
MVPLFHHYAPKTKLAGGPTAHNTEMSEKLLRTEEEQVMKVSLPTACLSSFWYIWFNLHYDTFSSYRRKLKFHSQQAWSSQAFTLQTKESRQWLKAHSETRLPGLKYCFCHLPIVYYCRIYLSPLMRKFLSYLRAGRTTFL